MSESVGSIINSSDRITSTHFEDNQERGHAATNTLLKMREIAQSEPGLVNYSMMSPGISESYAMGSMIIHSKDKQVKAGLTRIYVNESLQEGPRSSAVDRLAYANASKLGLPEFSEPTVATWFTKDMEEEKWHSAWSISHQALIKGKQIFGRTDLPTRKKWIAREKESFERYATQVLSEPVTDSKFTDLDQLFMECRTRKDNFASNEPSEIVMRIAEQKVRQDLTRDKGESLARFNTRGLGLPDNFVTDVMKKVGKEQGKSLFLMRLKSFVDEKRGVVIATLNRFTERTKATLNKLDEHTKATLVFMGGISVSTALAAISTIPGMGPFIGASAAVGLVATGYEIMDMFKMLKDIKLERRSQPISLA